MGSGSAGTSFTPMSGCREGANKTRIIFCRPLGLYGVWGSMIREWLERLLPEDAAQKCSGRVEVAMTALPSLKQTTASHFTSKEDVLEACLASAYVPFFLDGKLATSYRGTAAEHNQCGASSLPAELCWCSQVGIECIGCR